MFFSVIVPVYNVEKYLGECVDSIISQSCGDFELILVDDGSKDTSGAICDDYVARDSRIRVVHKENGGQSSARNAGIDAANGEFAVFLDSDDLICDKDFFADIKKAADTSTDIVAFRYCKYYDDKRIDECGISLAGIECEDRLQLLHELVRRDAFFCSCWSKCTRMSILKENNIKFDEKLSCEDMDWYFNVVSKAKSFKIIDKPYVYYRQRENSITATFKKKTVEDFIYTVETWGRNFNAIPNEKEREIMLSALAKLYCNLLVVYSQHADELKGHKKQIFSFRYLLKYDLNPRAAKISKFARIFGLNITCTVLNILGRKRK